MLNLLKSIVETITALLAFISHAVVSLVKLFAHIPEFVAFISSSFAILPTVIIPFAIASVSLYVVFFILNKQ